MKTLNIESIPVTAAAANRFGSAQVLALSIAESDPDLLEPALVVWPGRSTNNASPVREGCAGWNGWHDDGMSHGGRLEVEKSDLGTFIFTESSAYDSGEHFGQRPFVNLYDASGNERICRAGEINCMALDGWGRKLTQRAGCMSSSLQLLHGRINTRPDWRLKC